MTLNCATQSSKTDECRRNAGHRCPKRCSALELCSASCNEIIRDILALDGGVDLVSYHRGPRVRNDPKVMQKPLPDERLFVFTGSYKVFSNNAYCLSTTAPIASRLFLSTWFESRTQLISQAS